MSPADRSARLAKAQEVAALVSAKVEALLEPLDREMRIMKLKPEFQVIMWEAVLMAARNRMIMATPEAKQ